MRRRLLAEAGDQAASCAHAAPPIETVEPLDSGLTPDFACDTLTEAAAWITEALCVQ